MIREWSPWERSTGPRTESGKAAVSQNTYKAGEWKRSRELFKMLNTLFREQRDVVRGLARRSISV